MTVPAVVVLAGFCVHRISCVQRHGCRQLFRRSRCRFALAAVAPLALASTIAVAADPAPWQIRVEALRADHDALRATLIAARESLEPRVRHERPDLLPRLELAPTRRPSGYGILPDVGAPEPPRTVPLAESVYSLRHVETRIAGARERAGSLDETGEVTETVEAFADLADTLRNLDAHLDYHDFWQAEVAARPAFYRERNRWITEARSLGRRVDDGERSEALTAARSALASRVAGFTPTPGLALREARGGLRRLPVKVCTDIDERGFLKTFRWAVHQAFNANPAARERRFSVDLRFERISPRRLYPDGVPADGSPIDLDEHRGRFDGCALVLTTGARSTHARLGDAIFLGPAPLTSRVLAHEFGHLLGFRDAYLRGFDGDSGGPDGATLVEWTGLADDLMGSPGRGRVGAAMIDTLLRAYGAPPPPPT